MGIEIAISAARKCDIAEILEIERRSQPEPWTEQSFLEEFDRLQSRLLVARAPGAEEGAPPGAIAGYICYWCVADELQVLNVAVCEEFRRRGIARALLAHVLHERCGKKAGIATLEVRGGNIAARRLYESAGFRAVGERAGYYGAHEETAVLMELKIAGEEQPQH